MVGRMSKVVVVGLGYVGLPLAVRAAEVGFSVMGIDVNPCRVRSLLAGRSYVEDVAQHRVRRPGIRGGLQDHQGTGAKPRREGTSGVLHVREVGGTVGQGRGNGDHGHLEGLGCRVVRRGREAAPVAPRGACAFRGRDRCRGSAAVTRGGDGGGARKGAGGG